MSYPPQGGAGGGAGAPDNGMTRSIIAAVLGLLFCCPAIITGVLAVVASNKVQGAWASGDHAGAQKAAADAKRYANITFVLAAIGVVINVVYFVSVVSSSS